MKKLLLLSLLMLAVVITAVACTGDVNTDDTTVADTTAAAPADETTAAPADETTEPPVEETDPPVTEPEPETLPPQPEAPTATQVKGSWDSIFKNEENNFAQADGTAADKFTATPFKLDDTWTDILFRGWAGSGNAENKFVTFGYRVDLGDLVVVDGSFREAEADVIDAGGDARYVIPVPTEPLKGGMHYIRCYGVCADGTAVEILNIWIEGRDLTPLEAAQAWDIDKSVVTHLSFDELRGGDYFAPGSSATWDGIAKVNDSITTIQFWGWITFYGELGQFGYQIDDGEVVFNSAWAFVGDDHSVIESQKDGLGGDHGNRMLIDIPVAGLVGDHTVKVYYKNADETAIAILKEFTVSGPAILDTVSAGLHNNHLQIDAQSADNFSANISGWMGFDEFIPEALGWSVDGGAITWNGSINTACEDLIKIDANAGANGFRYSITASFEGLPYGDHEINFYAKLPSGDLCLLYTKSATNSDPSNVGNSTANFDTAENADLLSFFVNDGGAPGGCNYNGPYTLAGITSVHKTMDGTYEMTVKNLTCGNAGQAVVFFRGNANPNFGDPGYFGHDNNDPHSVGCAGIYVSIIDGNLRLNVKGQNEEGKAVPHIYTTPMSGKDLRVVDDNTALYFYEGDTLLATVALSGMEGGFATQAVVTLADGTTETLDDVCAAAQATSDIGFVARGVALSFDAVTVKGLAE